MKKLSTLFPFLLLALLTSSCGLPLIGKHVVHKSGTSRLYSSTDTTFQPYIAAFEMHAKNVTKNQSFSVGNIPINFHQPENNEHKGVCYIYSDNSREIIIDRTWWEHANDDDRESLIFHELGHCKLDRDHDDEKFQHQKLSMMNTYIVQGAIYRPRQSEYLHELFTKDKSPLMTSILGQP